jgi:uncharacterized membrane protein YGL010W
MHTQQQFLNEYAKTHRNPTNVRVHTICVPVILVASFGLLWSTPIGPWLGMSGPAARWINGATIGLLPILFFYFRLSVATGLQMLGVFALCALACLAAQTAGPMPLVWVCAGSWIAAWIAQFYGHYVEGAKPSFLDDLLFLLIGPIFVLDKHGLLAGGHGSTNPA